MSTSACDSPPSPLAPPTCILQNIAARQAAVYTRDSISFYHFSARCCVSEFPQVRRTLSHGVDHRIRERTKSKRSSVTVSASALTPSNAPVIDAMERTSRHICVRITATARQLVSSPLYPASASAPPLSYGDPPPFCFLLRTARARRAGECGARRHMELHTLCGPAPYHTRSLPHPVPPHAHSPHHTRDYLFRPHYILPRRGHTDLPRRSQHRPIKYSLSHEGQRTPDVRIGVGREWGGVVDVRGMRVV
ncbi:hypothetical protein C8F04DRAFT_1270141 [Mycena alexandri]|uniref:Uncharacterized protein n=1 Tax=Mycena alexandri TaxID=1745969 RepID=A0AAD6SBS3_9AGAR|nr:hypothetical protein C8F04DRAFT_1270141 [Mycena alexandri]